MTDGARDLLNRGIASAKAGENRQAIRYLERSLRQRPSLRQRVDAHYWLSKVSEDEPAKISHLEHALQLEPSHFLARRDLALIRGLLDSQDLVDPTKGTRATLERSPAATRFVCPQCGARLAQDVHTAQLLCSHCGYEADFATLPGAAKEVPEADFIQALASAKGHSLPQAVATLNCDGCGARFLLPDRLISESCPYCHAIYVLEESEETKLVSPSGLIPFRLNQGEAARQLRQHLDRLHLSRTDAETAPDGVFTPAWTFDITGEMPYRYLRSEGDDWVPQRGSQIVVVNDLPIAASRSLPPEFGGGLAEFDLSELVEFRPSLLAGWPAQTYDISATEAAMHARFQIVNQARSAARSKMHGRIRDFRPQAPELLVAAYRLVLLPLWLTSYRVGGETYLAMVNGQTGAALVQRPPRGILAWLERFLGRGKTPPILPRNA